MQGWQGKIADIQASTGSVETLTPEKHIYREYLGGVGLAARLLYNRIPQNADPLSPNNVIAVMTGPVTGTSFPGVGRVSICTRSPLTGVWGESSMGGNLGSAMKGAGYDGLLIRGTAQSPIYIRISPDGVSLHDASGLWGLDTYETEAFLKERYGQSTQVASIGRAGENLVRYATINHKRGSDSAGRCGMGAVLGSKHIKAIVVNGKPDVKVADPKQLSSSRRKLIQSYQEDAWVSLLRSGGTAWGTAWAFDLNDVPVKNWQVEAHDWREEGQRITGQAMEEAGFVVGRTTCFRCPIACRRIIQIDEGPWKIPESAGPEYETLGSLGAMLMIDDVRALCKANELCNRHGIDTITTGATIAWAIEAYEREMLTSEDIGGHHLTWGDPQLLLNLIEDIVQGEGIGSLLAQGSRRAALITGKGSNQHAIQVKGLECAMHHPRAMRGMEISYATGPRGASHNEGGSVPESEDLRERARAIQTSVNRAQINASAVFCNFTVGPLTLPDYAEILTAVTGYRYDERSLEQLGERIWHLRRAFNLYHANIAGKEDVLPDRIMKQLPPDPPFEDLLAAYYHVRGINENGIAHREKLEELGLDDIANTLRL